MQTNETTNAGQGKRKLVDANGLLEELFEKKNRPSLRWVGDAKKNRLIPFVKMGHFVMFDVEKVREAIAQRFTIQPRLAASRTRGRPRTRRTAHNLAA